MQSRTSDLAELGRVGLSTKTRRTAEGQVVYFDAETEDQWISIMNPVLDLQQKWNFHLAPVKQF